MSFTDHKITAFTHKIADLPDEPQIPAAELKSRFDACPEELRQSLNAVCDDAARLEARVEGIVVDTFGDTIDKEMLSDELAAELDGKATQSALASETAARESADDALDTRLTAAETALPLKCECYFGTYIGNGAASQTITLGFTPSILITCTSSGVLGTISGYEFMYGGICTPEHPVRRENTIAVEIIENGFRVLQNDNLYVRANMEERQYCFIAFK